MVGMNGLEAAERSYITVEAEEELDPGRSPNRWPFPRGTLSLACIVPRGSVKTLPSFPASNTLAGFELSMVGNTFWRERRRERG